MKCPSCQAEIPESSAFCNHCGGAVSETDTSASAPQPQSPAEAVQQIVRDADAQSEQPESPLIQGRYSKKQYLPIWIIWLIVSIVVIWFINSRGWSVKIAAIVVLIVAVGILGKMLWTTFSRRYRLTNQRLIVDQGIFSRTTDQTELMRVDDVRTQQSILQRVLGTGDVVVISTDATDQELVVVGVDDPNKWAEEIRTHMRALRRKSLFVENL
jgi:membrane protein YdbS with pleckstrin-like domain